MMLTPPDLAETPTPTPESLLADLAQVFLALLFVQAESDLIVIPRPWITKWTKELKGLLQTLRTAP